MMSEYQFDHFGVPVHAKQSDMIYFPNHKVWTTDYEKHPLRIEWIYFEKDTPFHTLIQTKPHVCYLVNDIQKSIQGKKILMPPEVTEGYIMAFIEENNIPIEFIQLI